MTYSKALLESHCHVGIWGTGYIGYSTMLHLAAEGIVCLGYDPDVQRVAQINQGQHPVPGLEGWLDIDPLPLLRAKQLRATEDLQDILRFHALVHIVAVPTEREGRPWWEPLRESLTHLAEILVGEEERALLPLIIIESTLAPGTTDELILPLLSSYGLEVGRDLLLGIAPRRDWFVSPDKTLRTLDRVYCGIDEASAQATYEVLHILCQHLHRASHYLIGELVKCVENAYRHVEITLANQLCLGYPNVDVREVLALASTKWNMALFQPSFGTGGYCIPLAGQYVIQGATCPQALTLLASASTSDLQMREQIAQAVLNRGRRRIGILGLSYRGDLKVAVMSPTLLIAQHLHAAGATVKIHDPYYSAQEIERITGLPTFDVPDDLEQFDTLLVSTDHARYVDLDVQEAVLSRADQWLILDNYGAWSDWEWPKQSQYYRAGSRGWLDAKVATLKDGD